MKWAAQDLNLEPTNYEFETWRYQSTVRLPKSQPLLTGEMLGRLPTPHGA